MFGLKQVVSLSAKSKKQKAKENIPFWLWSRDRTLLLSRACCVVVDRDSVVGWPCWIATEKNVWSAFVQQAVSNKLHTASSRIPYNKSGPVTTVFDRILSFPTGPNAERRSLDLTNGPSIFGRGMYARRRIWCELIVGHSELQCLGSYRVSFSKNWHKSENMLYIHVQEDTLKWEIRQKQTNLVTLPLLKIVTEWVVGPHIT